MVLGCSASCAKAKGLSDRPLETFGTKCLNGYVPNTAALGERAYGRTGVPSGSRVSVHWGSSWKHG